ncbi:MAG: pH-response regulator protein palH/rim21 [Thelocarpon impressellum]|nr:MAG: pH-response regulator protein palH/rim21 [Thelocarpon impressellum]
MSPGPEFFRRQPKGASATAPPTSTSRVDTHCTPFALPSGGAIAVGGTTTLSLGANAVFQPECTGVLVGFPDSPAPSNVADLHEPFYASIIVQTYALAAATVLSYTLVIMLLITPRTFFVGGPGGGRGFLGGRGLISGASGRTSIIGIGSRPWLQKVAALTVAVSLTIATADTFKVAAKQYQVGYMSATKLRDEVAGGTFIKSIRIISDTFLWLAQVQTLIRLFPRQKEKVIIKWVGFALISFETLFSILNVFVFKGNHSRTYVDAIPTISYLFELALSLLYAAWVIYYSITKRHFAFYHHKMRNICLVATLSMAAIVVPIVFFVLDISNPKLAGWGDYFRWVGAAAASVVVWEWVERIEALERDDRKDGVLGREIYDGDEMLDMTPSEEVRWPGHRPNQGSGGNGLASGVSPASRGWSTARRATHFPRSLLGPSIRVHAHCDGNTRNGPRAQSSGNPRFLMTGGHSHDPVAPSPVASPVSRTETTSATSTLYAVHHHPVRDMTPPVPWERSDLSSTPETAAVLHEADQVTGSQAGAASVQPVADAPRNNVGVAFDGPRAPTSRLLSANPFKRRRVLPPREVAASTATPRASAPATPGDDRHGLKTILGVFGKPSIGLRTRAMGRRPDAPLPVTVIPAIPRIRTVSPDADEKVDGAEDEAAEVPLPPSRSTSQRGTSTAGGDDDAIGRAPRASSTTPSLSAITSAALGNMSNAASSPGGSALLDRTPPPQASLHRRGSLAISETKPDRNSH